MWKDLPFRLLHHTSLQNLRCIAFFYFNSLLENDRTGIRSFRLQNVRLLQPPLPLWQVPPHEPSVHNIPFPQNDGIRDGWILMILFRYLLIISFGITTKNSPPERSDPVQFVYLSRKLVNSSLVSKSFGETHCAGI